MTPRTDDGSSIPEWAGRMAQRALEVVKARGRRLRLPCCICHQPIDYSIESTRPDGCTVQHVKSRKHFPHLTWSPSNHEPAHRRCNTSEGAGDRDTELVTSQDW